LKYNLINGILNCPNLPAPAVIWLCFIPSCLPN